MPRFATHALLMFALACTQALAISQSERDVQNLTNFPKLRQIATRGSSAARTYLNRVADAYTAAGYSNLSLQLRRSRALVMLYGENGKSRKSGAIKAARTATRNLEWAVTTNKVVKLPTAVGESLPDYAGLALIFAQNSRAALKATAHRRGLGQSLLLDRQDLWITQVGENLFTLPGSVAGLGSFSFSEGTFIVDGGKHIGTFILNHASTTNAGGTTTDSGSSLSLVGSISLVKSGAGVITLGGGVLFTSKVAFPPDVELPAEQDYTIYSTLTQATTIYGTEFPAGTRILNVGSNFIVPDGATALPLPYLPFGSWLALSVSSRLILAADADQHWLAFPADVTVPEDVVISTPALAQALRSGEIEIPAGSRLVKVGNDYADPEGAIVFPPGQLILEPVPAE